MVSFDVQNAIVQGFAFTAKPPEFDRDILDDELEYRGDKEGHGHGYFESPVGSSLPGRFDLESSGDNTYTVKNPYYNVGGKTYVAAVSSVTIENGIMALSITLSSTFPTTALVIYQSVAELQNAQKTAGTYVLPLYKFADGNIECDFRLGPPAVAWEFPS